VKTVLTESPAEAARFIKRGGLVAFPTETVYGLGADAFNERAIEKIFEAKQRPADNPLIAHVGRVEQIGSLAKEITVPARKFIEAFFPAPLTLVLPKSERVPLIATAGLETIGVRMPRHSLAQEFLRACEVPLVAPSANLSGRPSPTRWRAVYEDLNGRIDCILISDETTEIGLESTVVDCTADPPMVLRAGAVTLEELQTVIPQTRLYRPAEGERPKSPGLKHRHYSPRARVFLIESVGGQKGRIDNAAFIGLREPYEEFDLVRVCGSVEEYARELFAFFREADARGLEMIFCQTVEEKGIGLALMDRLRRAAEK
jgi:L-threonylcarbamoyladenylate synthase